MSFKIAPRESISRCVTYDNKFRTYVDEPKLKDVRRQKYAKDSIESESARLEREMTNKFLKGSFSQEGSNVRFVKQVAKFVFVAVYTPPLFIVYTLPKLIFQYGLPFVADLTGNFMRKLSAGLSPLASWAVQTSGIFIEKFSKIYKKTVEKLSKVFKSSQDFIKDKFQRLAKRVTERFKKMAAPFVKLALFLSDKIQRKAAAWYFRLNQFFNWLINAIKPWLPSLPKFKFSKPAFITKIAHYLNELKGLPRKVDAKIRRAIKQIKEFIPVAQAAVIQFLKKVASLKSIPIGIATFFWEILRANYQGWIEPYIQWIVPTCRWTKNTLSRHYQSAARLLEVGFSYIEQAVENLGNFIARVARKAASPFVRAAGYFSAKLSNLYLQAASVSTRIGEVVSSISSGISGRVVKAADAIKKSALSVGTSLAKIPTYLINKLQSAVLVIMKGIEKTKSGIQKGYIFMKVMFKLTFQLIISE